MTPTPKTAPASTTRRPSKPSHGPEELLAALEGQLGRPPSKSIHLGHPPASRPGELEARRRHPSRHPKTDALEDLPKKSKEFYAYGRRTLSTTQS